MADTLSKVERSLRMSLVRSKNTKPELIVRTLVHRLGFRFRLHVAALPGTPDLVFPRLGAVVFVHGCFWHRHPSSRCTLARLPKTRREFWIEKLEGNRRRDEANARKLRNQGWKVLQIWECELRDKEKLETRLLRFLG
jgi:DNA mismatch endonuclease (patch repair protein)